MVFNPDAIGKDTECFKYGMGVTWAVAQIQSRKECALCGTTLPVGSEVSLCNECMKCADCCVGLERLKD